jgi:hypothetical protein
MEKLKKAGIRFNYIKKQNQGQMKAVQDGVLATNGEYLTWPDVDDFMEPEYIQDKITFFMSNPQTDILINAVDIYNINDKTRIIEKGWSKDFRDKDDLIARFIENRDAGYMPGAFMLKMNTFLKVYPDKLFFSELRAGVAIPLVFPFICQFTPMYLDKPLYRYYIHSNNQHSVNELRDINNMELLYENVIKYMSLNDDERSALLKMIHNRCLQLKLGHAYRTMNKDDFYRIKKQLKQSGAFRFKDFAKEMLMMIGITR